MAASVLLVGGIRRGGYPVVKYYQLVCIINLDLSADTMQSTPYDIAYDRIEKNRIVIFCVEPTD